MSNRRFHLITAAAVALVLGCAGSFARHGEPPGWSVRPDGILLHDASRTRFLPAYGELIRRDYRSYDSVGLNGAVNYERRQPHLVVTVFVYPTSHGEPNADHEFAKAVRNAARAMSATPAESQPLTIREEPQELSGHLALLKQGSDVISWLALVPSGGWYYKAQATASLSRDGALAESASAAVVILQDTIFSAD